jgi:hypothetical protein
MDCFDADPEGDEDERGGVEKGRQHAGALIAKGLALGGRAGLEVNRDEGERQGQEVGHVVAGFGEQRQRMRAQSGDQGKRHVEQRRQHGEPQHSACFSMTCWRWREHAYLKSMRALRKEQKQGPALLNGSNLEGGLAGTGTEALPLVFGDTLGLGMAPEDGHALAQPAPALGDQDAVFRAAWLVADGAGHADFDLTRIDDSGEGRDVLRALVDDAGDFVLVEQHVAGGAVFGGDLKAVEQHAVDDASEADQALAAFALKLFFGWSLAVAPETTQSENSADGERWGVHKRVTPRLG